MLWRARPARTLVNPESSVEPQSESSGSTMACVTSPNPWPVPAPPHLAQEDPEGALGGLEGALPGHAPRPARLEVRRGRAPAGWRRASHLGPAASASEQFSPAATISSVLPGLAPGRQDSSEAWRRTHLASRLLRKTNQTWVRNLVEWPRRVLPSQVGVAGRWIA